MLFSDCSANVIFFVQQWKFREGKIVLSNCFANVIFFVWQWKFREGEIVLQLLFPTDLPMLFFLAKNQSWLPQFFFASVIFQLFCQCYIPCKYWLWVQIVL